MTQTYDTLLNTKIILGYPYELVREGLAKILEGTGFKVLGKSSDMMGVTNQCESLLPDIVILDAGIEGFGVDTIAELAGKTAVVVLTSKKAHVLAPEDILNAGARGLISVDQPVDVFVRALRTISDGGVVVSNGLAGNLRARVTLDLRTQSPSSLTSREYEVLSLLGNGLTNREIGERLFVSEHTVKVHLRNVLTKLNLRNRQQAAAYAAQRGLVNDEK